MVVLRKATAEDMGLLYDWANDPIVRKNSFNSAFISYETHQKWFRNMMSDESVLQYILMDDETPIGQIRLNVEGEEAEIGYSISEEYRGKGFGRKILQMIVAEVKENYPEIKRMVAKVKPENVASNKLFVSEGYEEKYSCYTMEIV